MEIFFQNNLQNLAIIPVAAQLFQGEDIKACIKRCLVVEKNRNRCFLKLRVAFVEDILVRTKKFTLPDVLRDCLKNTVVYMAKELVRILEKVEYLKSNLKKIFAGYIIDALVWSYRGSVDLTRTVHKILQNDNIDVYHRFILSCAFCFKEDIVNLWDEKLSKDSKRDFRKDEFDIIGNEQKHLLTQYWRCYLMFKDLGFEKDWVPDYKVIVGEAISHNNLLAVKYFWGKLSSLHKLALANPVRENPRISADILLFYMTNQDEPDRTAMMRAMPIVILNTVLENWVWNNNFCDLLRLHHSSLSEDDLYPLFQCFIDTLEAYPVKDALKTLFGNFCRLCLQVLHVDNFGDIRYHFLKRICLLEIDSLDVLLEDMTFREKVMLFTDDLYIIQTLLEEKKYDMIVYIMSLVYGDYDVSVFRSKLLDTGTDSFFLKILYLGDLKLLNLMKDLAALTDDEWDAFKGEITGYEGDQPLINLLENFGTGSFIEFLDYLYAASGPTAEAKAVEKVVFVETHAEHILYHMLKNDLKENVELVKSFLACYFTHADVVALLKSILLKHPLTFYSFKKEIFELCCLQQDERQELDYTLLGLYV